MSEPLVSVVMAVKNSERFLADALDSVMAQSHDNVEIVIVDGNSTDRSEEIARSYPRTRWLSQAGKGFADAWNQGITAANGEFVALLDSDDRWTPGKLAAQLAILEANPQLDAVIGRVRFVAEPGMPLPPGFRARQLDGDHMAPMPGALLVRRELFESIGLFPTDLEITNDVEWFTRLKDAGHHFGRVDDVVILKRLHDRNISYFEAREYNRELLGILRASVARQRGASP